VLEGLMSGTAPIEINVTAPVFWVSPRNDEMGNPEHHMTQTAAGLNNNPFIYKTIVNNSQNHPLLYELIAAPRHCSIPNGMCISPTGEISSAPLEEDMTVPLDPQTWHRVEVRVTDTV